MSSYNPPHNQTTSSYSSRKYQPPRARNPAYHQRAHQYNPQQHQYQSTYDNQERYPASSFTPGSFSSSQQPSSFAPPGGSSSSSAAASAMALQAPSSSTATTSPSHPTMPVPAKPPGTVSPYPFNQRSEHMVTQLLEADIFRFFKDYGVNLPASVTDYPDREVLERRLMVLIGESQKLQKVMPVSLVGTMQTMKSYNSLLNYSLGGTHNYSHAQGHPLVKAFGAAFPASELTLTRTMDAIWTRDEDVRKSIRFGVAGVLLDIAYAHEEKGSTKHILACQSIPDSVIAMRIVPPIKAGEGGEPIVFVLFRHDVKKPEENWDHLQTTDWIYIDKQPRETWWTMCDSDQQSFLLRMLLYNSTRMPSGVVQAIEQQRKRDVEPGFIPSFYVPLYPLEDTAKRMLSVDFMDLELGPEIGKLEVRVRAIDYYYQHKPPIPDPVTELSWKAKAKENQDKFYLSREVRGTASFFTINAYVVDGPVKGDKKNLTIRDYEGGFMVYASRSGNEAVFRKVERLIDTAKNEQLAVCLYAKHSMRNANILELITGKMPEQVIRLQDPEEDE